PQHRRQVTLLVSPLPVPMSREPLFGARQKLPTALPAREADHRERATAVVRSTYVREAQEVERLGSFIVCRLRLGGEAPEEQQPRLVVGQLRSEEHTSELQSRVDLVCRLL